eukprot:gnl/MRDRNA2_/MRDRNA2_64864_c0_seq2.p1 gnl/MRDRNA2_/MRDRNA2_64864_c0~~gnl/MRDRNA2_/MRDRNA2_64864_c0_seq2.p1  ORF type:complete len:1073 (-),score=205.80 gnl/MRDRNA2_/MRDRNA2_64864_c0_seq2:325-3543(-)
MAGRHLGMNIPLGGLGNPSPFEDTIDHIVGPKGSVLRTAYDKQNNMHKYQLISGVQGGHVYMRWDSFGSQPIGLRRPEDTFAPKSTKKSVSMSSQQRRIRVSSVPPHSDRLPLKHSELTWLKNEARVIATGMDERLVTMPPSETALAVLIMNFNNSQDVDTKVVQKFYKEIQNGEAAIVVRGMGATRKIMRKIRVVVLHVDCQGMLLVSKEKADMETVTEMRLPSLQMFLTESLEDAINRLLDAKLSISGLRELGLEGRIQDVGTIVNESEELQSNTFSGLINYYDTYTVKLSVQPRLAVSRLGFAKVKYENMPSASDSAHLSLTQKDGGVREHCFVTRKKQKNFDVKSKEKKMFWFWVPSWEVFNALPAKQQISALGQSAIDSECWLRQAFRTEGLLEVPEAEEALAQLFKHVGINVDMFGQGKCKSIRALWLELVSQECFILKSGHKLLRVCEIVLIKITRNDKLLIKTSEESDGVINDKKKRLVVVQKWRGEDWQDAVRRALSQKLHLTDKEMREVLKPPVADPSSFYGIVEEPTTLGESYPMPRTFRVYLVAHEMQRGFCSHAWKQDSKHMDDNACFQTDFQSLGTGTKRLHWQWVSTEDAYQIKELKGLQYNWESRSSIKKSSINDKGSAGDFYRISSLLIGVEGSSYGSGSPFGWQHGWAGNSNANAATGGRKWRSYRDNGGRRVPGEFGSMRLWLTEAAYEEFKNVIEILGLGDAKDDLMLALTKPNFDGEQKDNPLGVFSRNAIERRNREKILFQEILSSNANQAREAVLEAVEVQKKKENISDITEKECKGISQKAGMAPRKSVANNTRSAPGVSASLSRPGEVKAKAETACRTSKESHHSKVSLENSCSLDSLASASLASASLSVAETNPDNVGFNQGDSVKSDFIRLSDVQTEPCNSYAESYGFDDFADATKLDENSTLYARNSTMSAESVGCAESAPYLLPVPVMQGMAELQNTRCKPVESGMGTELSSSTMPPASAPIHLGEKKHEVELATSPANDRTLVADDMQEGNMNELVEDTVWGASSCRNCSTSSIRRTCRKAQCVYPGAGQGQSSNMIPFHLT